MSILLAMCDSLRRTRGGRRGAPLSTRGRGCCSAWPENASACCRRKGERPEACNALAGAQADRQIGGARLVARAQARRSDGKRDDMTIPDGWMAAGANAVTQALLRVSRPDRHRSGSPGDVDRRCCADHGPGHEIVKKPFAAPEGGEYTSQSAMAAGDVRAVSPSWKAADPTGGAARFGLRQRTPTERCSFIAGARETRKRRSGDPRPARRQQSVGA